MDIDVFADAVDRAVALGRIVDRKHDQVAVALVVRRCHRDRDALVLPGEPVRDGDPRCPAASDVARCVEIAADPEQALILPDGVVDHRDDKILPAAAIQVGQGDISALVLPGEPVRDGDPRCPAAGDPTGVVERLPHTIEALILSGWVVDHQHNHVLRAIVRQASDGDAATLVFEREPVWYRSKQVYHDRSSS